MHWCLGSSLPDNRQPMHQSSRGRRTQCTRLPSQNHPSSRPAACRADPQCCRGRHSPVNRAATPSRCERPRPARAVVALSGLLITGAVISVTAVTWQPWRHDAGAAPRASMTGSAQREERRAAVVANPAVVASRLRAGMTVEYHGRRWTVVRVNRVTTRPGILLELREAGMPGFHILYVDPSSLLTVVGPT